MITKERLIYFRFNLCRRSIWKIVWSWHLFLITNSFRRILPVRCVTFYARLETRLLAFDLDPRILWKLKHEVGPKICQEKMLSEVQWWRISFWRIMLLFRFLRDYFNLRALAIVILAGKVSSFPLPTGRFYIFNAYPPTHSAGIYFCHFAAGKFQILQWRTYLFPSKGMLPTWMLPRVRLTGLSSDKISKLWNHIFNVKFLTLEPLALLVDVFFF